MKVIMHEKFIKVWFKLGQRDFLYKNNIFPDALREMKSI